MLASRDAGHRWEGPWTVFRDPTGKTGYWEARITPLCKSSLLATCWAHDFESDSDLPNHFAMSQDGGQNWSRPLPSPATGQTGWPVTLASDRVLFIYNQRRHPVGIRGQIARLTDERWAAVFDGAIWRPENRTASSITKDDYAVTGFQFGAPSGLMIDDCTLLIVYWCVEKERAGVNWSLLTFR